MLSQRNVNAVNDLPDHRMPGYLLLGVQNDGTIDGLKVDDALMKRISAIRSDGNILPLPVSTEKVVTEKGDVLVVEVTPSFDTPVRYRGRTFIRIGPRRDIASAEEERILAERCAASLPTAAARVPSSATFPPSRLAPPTTTAPTPPTPWAPCMARKGRC